MNRIIGKYTGQESGPLALLTGGTHGNEPAGVRALQEVFRLLALEPSFNPGFVFSGTLVGLVGNVQALEQKRRFLREDLNRLWTTDQIRRILRVAVPTDEDREAAELIEAIHAEIEMARPEALVFLDIHTTSAEGGIFSIPTDEKSSLRLTKELHAPVVLDMKYGLDGTLVQYAAEGHFQIGGYPKHNIAAAFEAGQHDDPESVDRAVAAILNALRACGCIRPEDLDSRHEAILQRFTRDMPKVTRLRHTHRIRPGEAFRMRPGYKNFQAVRAGEHLADDTNGPVTAPLDGLILMPLYQPQGSDGFFIIEPI
jgi:succinylglutamate desuccinylase